MIHRRPSRRALLFSFMLLLLLSPSYTTSALPKPESSVDAASSLDDNNSESTSPFPSIATLREYLVLNRDGDGDKEGHDGGVYLAMGAAFFGFYGYFGALAGMEDEVFRFSSLDGINNSNSGLDRTEFASTESLLVQHKVIRGVSGASAGAMAAVMLAAGISPHTASEFVSKLKLADFADLGGLGAFLKGDKFESLMSDCLQSLSPIAAKSNKGSPDISDDDAAATATATTRSEPHSPLQLEDGLIPVAVSVVDIQPQITYPEPSWLQLLVSPWKYIVSTYFPTAKILTHGSMARAARASACFPVLFQPVGWIDRSSWFTSSPTSNNTSSGSDHVPNAKSSLDGVNDYSLLIDGGIFDIAGYNGLKEIISKTTHDNFEQDKEKIPQKNKIRVLNMVIGSFGSAPPGPEAVSKSLGVAVDSVFSLSITGLPNCGPFAMHNGPLANHAARMAIRAAIDRPIIATTSTFASDGTTGDDDDDQQKRQHHFVLEIDASSFVDTKL